MLRILYRGPLDSCNYACGYCPFAKRPATRETLQRDQLALERFVEHVSSQRSRRYGVFFTPWGEALTHKSYQRAIAQLSQHDHVERVAIQTNLSTRPGWLDAARADRVGIWATYHPGEIELDAFVTRAKEYDSRGVSLSVGVVGLPQHLDEARALREALPKSVYVWVNAAKTTHGHYAPELRAAFEAIDPLFAINTQHHPSLGRPCNAGETVVSVDGEGNGRRCHFVDERLGNLYDGTLYAELKPRTCPNQTCGCHIGYVHMPHLKLLPIFGDGVLERVPLPT